ncbi:hypothetical protein AXY43_23075 [Clostridium sp. MF28]|uniref:phage portal protein n=1 Tax=Clostridium TaxID=1485 RepID=UPI000CF92CDD|nr:MULTISPECIES: phage portal protein [Clostridium]AVK50664.1 hypothetical protein AXY43_23075 [Clostridium sp. MF28]PSM59006.1 phage portal protein [Clostridium diolis]
MGFLLEKREIETIDDLNNTISGTNTNEITVNKDTILNLSAIASSVELITSLIASLDFKLYKKIDKLKLEEIDNDKRLFLLNKEANYFTNANLLKKNMVKDMLLDGISYINVDKTLNDVMGLYYVDSKEVSCLQDNEAIHKDIILSIRGNEVDIHEFIVACYSVKDGLKGNGIVAQNKELLETALRLQGYLNKNLKAGGGRKGVWQSEKKLGAGEFIDLKQDVKDIQETDEPIVLNSFMKYSPLTNTNRDMQLIENFNLINKQLLQLFGLKEDLTEEDFKTFVKTKLNTLVNAIECAIDKTLLLETEKEENYCFKLDLDELTEADIRERFEAYKLSLDSGIESINEIRLKENLEPINGLDLHKMTIGQALFNTTDGTWIIPNLGVTGGGDNENIDAKNRIDKRVDKQNNSTQQNTPKEQETEDK